MSTLLKYRQIGSYLHCRIEYVFLIIKEKKSEPARMSKGGIEYRKHTKGIYLADYDIDTGMIQTIGRSDRLFINQPIVEKHSH